MNPTITHVLLVEDNPTDVMITQEALDNAKVYVTLHVVENGVEAMAFLHREGVHAHAPRPNLILLDLNMPRKGGQEVLIEIKADEALRSIPVVILTTSKSDADVLKAYECHANFYIAKPVDFEAFTEVIRTIQKFWFTMVTLPPNKQNRTYYNTEFRLHRHDGIYRNVTARGVPVLNPDGSVREWVGGCADITERKESQEQIAEQATFLDKTQDAIIVRDLKGDILFWNKGAEQMYGWPREEVVGRDMNKLLYANPKKFEEVNELTISKGEWSGELVPSPGTGMRSSLKRGPP